MAFSQNKNTRLTDAFTCSAYLLVVKGLIVAGMKYHRHHGHGFTDRPEIRESTVLTGI